MIVIITELASSQLSEQVGPVAIADRKLRELWSSLPLHLRCPIINGGTASKDWLAGPAFTGNVPLAMQQIRLGFVFLSGLCECSIRSNGGLLLRIQQGNSIVQHCRKHCVIIRKNP